MPQTSFAERLQRIENAQGQSVKDRMLVGLSEELEAEADPKSKSKGKVARKRKGKSKGLPLRFIAGFGLMFGTFYGLGQMPLIEGTLADIDVVAPHIDIVRAGIAVMVIGILIFFGFKLQRAAFRVLSEPARLPFAIGMVAGLALGMGPTELTDGMLAQLSLDQN